MMRHFLLLSIFWALVMLIHQGLAIESDANSFSPFLTFKREAEINERAKGLWRASAENGFLKGATLTEIKRLLGARLEKIENVNIKTFPKFVIGNSLPKSFDASKTWPHCSSISEIADQAGCGSCWAVAAAGAMTDRHCIATGDTNVRISAGNLLSCCTLCGFGCNGGIPYIAWLYWVWNGLTSLDCQPYPFPSCSHHNPDSEYPPCIIESTPPCNETCADGSHINTYYHGLTSYAIQGELDFMHELYHNGPFEVGFTVYEDFLYYKEGVYKATNTDSPLGGHAVRLVGWGELNGVKYWKMANSWNKEWGNAGYFLILRGTNECGIEENGVAGLPKYT